MIFCPSIKFKTEEYYSILDKIGNEDKLFMENNFHYEKQRDLIIVNYRDERIDSSRLKRILDLCNYHDRISKWFHVITEDQIKLLLPNLGSESFRFDNEIVNIMISDFKLKLNKEYCA